MKYSLTHGLRIVVLACLCGGPLPWCLAQNRAASKTQPDAERKSAGIQPGRYEADLKAFIRELDRTYPFFDLKGIRADWTRAKPQFLERAAECGSDEEFVRLVADVIKCLRDAHAQISEAKVAPPPPPPEFYPGLSFLPAAGNRVVIMTPPQEHASALPAGTIVKRIDGEDARSFLERRAKDAWSVGGYFSSPRRARLFEYRIPLRGEKGEKHKLVFETGGQEREITLENKMEARGWPHTYNLPADLKRVGRSCFHTKLSSGIGYIYLRRVDGDVVTGLREAFATHRDVLGWIVDLRGNSGGGYGSDLIEQIKTMPRPVAVLIDAGCISAGETLARDFARFAGARRFGSTTAGSSSSKRTWRFPSGILSVTLPTRSRWRNDRKPIEFNGIEPDEAVEAVPEEVRKGQNSVILRAEAYIRGR